MGRVAVLSPVQGAQFDSGLKRIANVLQEAGIEYECFYDDFTDDSARKIVSLAGNSKKCNLMTVHGSKGLEFDVVFLTKLQDHMMY